MVTHHELHNTLHNSNSMAIDLGPILANQHLNLALNVLAPDPSALDIGLPLTHEFASAKRKRIEISRQFATDEELQVGNLMLHRIEHRLMANANEPGF